MINENQKKTIGQRHIFTLLIIERLISVQEAETIPYDELSELIGIDIRPNHNGYSYQKSARDILEREENIVFEAIGSIGLRRMTPEEVGLSTYEKYTREKKSCIFRNMRRIQTVNDHFDNLSTEAQQYTTFARTVLQFDAEFSKKKNQKKISDKIKETKNSIVFDDTVSLFSM